MPKTKGRLYFEIVGGSSSVLKVEVKRLSGAVVATFEAELKPLQEIATQIRDRLNKLCAEYVANRPGERPSERDLPRPLQHLARDGDAMRRSFFGGAKELHRGKDMLTRYENVPVTFVLQRGMKVFLPWGLMFDLSPSETASNRFPTLTRADLRLGFWSERHNLSVMYRYNDSLLHPPRQRIKADATKLLSAFHGGALRYADPNHAVTWPHEFDTWDSFLDYVSDSRDAGWLLYFFCHARENKLYLRDSDYALVPDLFISYLSGRRRHGLVFLNGCQTGLLQQGRSWQEAAHSEGLAGCIATEAIVPTRFAWRFGRDFMHFLASGVTPENAMGQLRQRHWPLSLLYSLYCVPDTAAPSSEATLPRPQETNYSALSLGDATHRFATLPFRRAARRLTNLVHRGPRDSF
jgi:hypothetical protein